MGRPSSPIRFSDRRNGYHNPQHDDESPINHRRHRSRSPSYARYSPEHHRCKSPVYRRSRSRSRSPDRRKPIPRRGNYNPRRERGNYGGNIVPEEESDEELRGLTFEEYRRLKRQKLRRSLKFSIWNVTPSPPPRSRNDVSDDDLDSKEVESDSDSESKGKVKKSSKSRVTDDRVTKSGKDIDSGSGSGSGSGSDSEQKGKVKKSSRVRVKKSRKDTESGSESDSGSVSDSDSRSRKRSRNKSSRRRKNKRKSRKSYDSDEDSDEEKESSEEDRKRRKSKSRRGSSNRKKKSSKRRRSKDSETEDETESSGKETRSNNKTKTRKTASESSEEDAVRGKSVSDIEETGLKIVEESNLDEVVINPTKEVQEVQKMAVVLENEPLVGPQPLPKAEGHISYGGALRPGEGDAIAQYVQQGKRIPRRGEVGLSADEISKYEDLGYVMSGSRHQRMNAIRIRKENQVYSAEDKRALAMYNFEEKAKREGKVMADLTRLVSRTIGETVVSNHDPFGAGKDEGEE